MNKPKHFATAFSGLAFAAHVFFASAANSDMLSTILFLSPARDSQDAPELACYAGKYHVPSFNQVYPFGKYTLLRNNQNCVAGISEEFCATTVVRARDCEPVMEFHSSSGIAEVVYFDSLAQIIKRNIELYTDGDEMLSLLNHPTSSQRVIWAPIITGDLFIILVDNKLKAFESSDRRMKKQ